MATGVIDIKFKKLTSTATEPTRERSTDAGIDLYASTKIRIPANNRETVSTGYAVAIPEGYYGQVQERSGYSLKNTLILKAGVIDSEYRGEIKLVFQNSGDYPIMIEAGDKIAQLIIHKLPKLNIQFVSELDTTDRGTKGFGSSGF